MKSSRMIPKDMRLTDIGTKAIKWSSHRSEVGLNKTRQGSVSRKRETEVPEGVGVGNGG